MTSILRTTLCYPVFFFIAMIFWLLPGVAQADHGPLCAGLTFFECSAVLDDQLTECANLVPVSLVGPCIDAVTPLIVHLNEPVVDPDDDDDPVVDPDDGNVDRPGASLYDFEWGNPARFESFEEIVIGILQVLVTLSIPIIVLMLIYAGFLYVSARGNAEQIKKATTALTYAIIGALLIIGAVAIAGIMRETLCEFRPDGSPGCPVTSHYEPINSSPHA